MNDALSDKVRKALATVDFYFNDGAEWTGWPEVRAELLRLASENMELRGANKRMKFLLDSAEAELAALRARTEWQPIETAPKQLKVLARYKNSHGHWRTVTAIYYPDGTLPSEAMTDDFEDEFAPSGWYETSETHEFIYPTDCPPTHWMPLPPPPKGEG